MIADYLIAPGGVAAAHGSWQPLGFVDLAACAPTDTIGPLPPFPLIGLGDRHHPLAAALDTVVEPPVSADALIRHIGQAPHAAAALVQLLRATETLPVAHALTLESQCYAMLQGSTEHARWLARQTPPPAMPAGDVRVEREGPLLSVTLDRAAARNAIDRPMRDRLHEAFTLAALDPEITAIRLRGAGDSFSIGGDLAEFGTTRDPATAHLIRARTLPAAALLPRAAILDVCVQGGCVGAGVEIAAFAGRLTARPRAWFQLPETAMGLVPGAGGCVSLPRRIGRQRTALMILSGRRIGAGTALGWGLIDAIEHGPPADEGGTHAHPGEISARRRPRPVEQA